MKHSRHQKFREYSELAKQSLKAGDFEKFSEAHKSIANILRMEGNYQDEIKSRILAFYFDVSGLSQMPYIDSENTDAIADAAEIAGLTDDQLSGIFFNTIKLDTAPKHSMTLVGSHKLLMLCLNSKWKKAIRIVENLK